MLPAKRYHLLAFPRNYYNDYSYTCPYTSTFSLPSLIELPILVPQFVSFPRLCLLLLHFLLLACDFHLEAFFLSVRPSQQSVDFSSLLNEFHFVCYLLYPVRYCFSALLFSRCPNTRPSHHIKRKPPGKNSAVDQHLSQLLKDLVS